MAKKTLPTATVGEAYLALLFERGISRVFMNGGTDFPSIGEAYERAATSGLALPKPLVVSHENVALGMAHGAYLATGRPQAVMIHTNVGTANAVMGMLNARHDRIPILLTAGRTPLFEAGAEGARSGTINWAQEMYDQAGMVREATKWDYELRDGVQLEAVIDRAISLAMSEPRAPIYLTLPREVLARPLANFAFSATSASLGTDPYPSVPAVAELAGLLANARFPVIVTSSAAADPGAFQALSDVALRYGIGILENSPRFVNASSAHPNHLGYQMESVFADADVLCFIECDVPWMQEVAEPPEETTIIQCGVDPLFARYPIRTHRSDLSITASARPLLEALSVALDANATKIDPTRAQRIADVAETRRNERNAAFESRAQSGSALNKVFMNWALKQAIDEDTVVVNEYWAGAGQHQPTKEGTGYHHPPAGGLGWALPAAMGIQLERPGATVLATLGDGAYLFSNPAACHQVMSAYELPVLTIVCSNGHWGAINGVLAETTGRRLEELNQSHRYEQYAEATGGYGEMVTERDDLLPALQRALKVVREERRHANINVVSAD